MVAVFSVVKVAYKQEATSTAINALMDSIIAHDHRDDGTQGVPIKTSRFGFETVVSTAAQVNVTQSRVVPLPAGVFLTAPIPIVSTGDSALDAWAKPVDASSFQLYWRAASAATRPIYWMVGQP